MITHRSRKKVHSSSILSAILAQGIYYCGTRSGSIAAVAVNFGKACTSSASMPPVLSKDQEKPMSAGCVAAAMAYRVKYRRENKKLDIMLRSIAPHPDNRRGVYPNGETVCNLGLSILNEGFSLEEANHAGVCVEEVPAGVEIPKEIEKTYERIKDYNFKKCTDERLSVCFAHGMSDIMYGSLSHSHLILVLLALKNNVKWPLGAGERADKLKQWTDTDGSFSSQKIIDLSPTGNAWKAMWEGGISMEVLSHKMILEEPAAAALISQALNRGQALALQTSVLTAIKALMGQCLVNQHKLLNQEIGYPTVRENLRDELPDFVDETEFVDLFSFVLDLGGAQKDAMHLIHFVRFGERFVNPTLRRLRLESFSKVREISNDYNWTKICMLVRALRSQPFKTWCPCPDKSLLGMPDIFFKRTEEVLTYFHVDCKDHLPQPESEELLFLVDVDLSATAVALDAVKEKAKDPAKHLLLGLWWAWKRVKEITEKNKMAMPKPVYIWDEHSAWMDFASVSEEAERLRAQKEKQRAEEESKAKQTSAAPLPRLIQYDERGRAINSQQIVQQEERQTYSYNLPVNLWAVSPHFKEGTVERADDAAMTLGMCNVAFNAKIESLPISMISTDGKKPCLRVKGDVPPGGIRLWPFASKPSKVVRQSAHSERAEVTLVRVKGHEHKKITRFVMPDVRIPKLDDNAVKLKIECHKLKEHIAELQAGNALASGPTEAPEEKPEESTRLNNSVTSQPNEEASPLQDSLDDGKTADLPKTNSEDKAKEPSAAVAVKGGGSTDVSKGVLDDDTLWTWNGDEALNPFWLVARKSAKQLRQDRFITGEKQEFNMGFETKTVQCMSLATGGSNGQNFTWTLELETMINTKEIKDGELLLLQVDEPAEIEKKRKETTWINGIKDSSKKQKGKVTGLRAMSDDEV